jgi:hypothetical protein
MIMHYSQIARPRPMLSLGLVFRFFRSLRFVNAAFAGTDRV